VGAGFGRHRDYNAKVLNGAKRCIALTAEYRPLGNGAKRGKKMLLGAGFVVGAG